MSRKTVELRKKLNQTRGLVDSPKSNGGRVRSGPSNPYKLMPHRARGRNTYLKPGSQPSLGKECCKLASDSWMARLVQLSKTVGK